MIKIGYIFRGSGAAFQGKPQSLGPLDSEKFFPPLSKMQNKYQFTGFFKPNLVMSLQQKTIIFLLRKCALLIIGVARGDLGLSPPKHVCSPPIVRAKTDYR